MASSRSPDIAEIDELNPLGTDGFEFVEFTAPDPARARHGCSSRWASRRSAGTAPRTCSLYRQGDINFILNWSRPASAARFAQRHGPSACAMAFRVKDAARGLQARARARRQAGVEGPVGPMELNIPAIEGIGGIDPLPGRPLRRARRSTTSTSCRPTGDEHKHEGVGLTYIDHLTHNVHRGRMDHWAGLLRAALQLPRDPLLRHRGQADRPHVAGR